jgi:hypothetical protein
VVDKTEDQNLEDYNRGHRRNSRRTLRVPSHDAPDAIQINLNLPNCSIYKLANSTLQKSARLRGTYDYSFSPFHNIVNSYLLSLLHSAYTRISAEITRWLWLHHSNTLVACDQTWTNQQHFALSIHIGRGDTLIFKCTARF